MYLCTASSSYAGLATSSAASSAAPLPFRLPLTATDVSHKLLIAGLAPAMGTDCSLFYLRAHKREISLFEDPSFGLYFPIRMLFLLQSLGDALPGSEDLHVSRSGSFLL